MLTMLSNIIEIILTGAVFLFFGSIILVAIILPIACALQDEDLGF